MTLTLGELVSRRRLKHSSSPKGYVPDQLAATVMGDTSVLSWVDDSGAVCVVYCTYRDDEWVTHPQVVRAGLQWIELRPVPRSLATNDKYLRCIQLAQSKKKGRRSQAGSKPENDAPSDDGAEESSDDTA